MSRSSRRFLSGCFALLPILLLFTGCAPAGTQTSPTAALRSPDPAFSRFYTQKVRWHACEQSAQCANVKVPLDWSTPDGETISLAVVRHKPTGRSQGSLFMNPGGPGQAAIDYVGRTDYRDYFFGKQLQQHYTLIAFDTRGVGRSRPAVRCLDAAGMDDFLYRLPTATPGSAAYIQESRSQLKAFGEACERKTGALLAHMDSMSTVRDMDVLRAISGDARLNYLGYSYGTKLGALYAQTFPDRVGRFVLDGAVNPALGNLASTLGQARGFDQATKRYLSWCLSQSNCPLSGKVAAAGKQLHRLIADRQKHPLRVSDGRWLGVSAAVTGVSQAMYSKDLWPRLTTALRQLRRGNPNPLMRLADEYNGRSPNGTYESNTTEAFYATSCLDSPVENADTSAAQRSLWKAGGILGDFWADGTSMCDGWPISATGRPGRIRASGAAPIMVVGTTHDPATPYSWAQALARQLQSGFLVTNEGDGHTAYSTAASRCLRGAVEGFLVRGTKPATGLRCR